MKTSASFFYACLLSLILSEACSNNIANQRHAFDKKGESQDPGMGENPPQQNGADSDKGYYRLALKVLDIDEASKQSFPFSSDAMTHINAEGLITFARADGKSISFDGKLNRWSSAQQAPEKLDYDTLYSFGPDGFLGIKDDILSSRSGPGKIERIPFQLPKGKVLSVGPGFYVLSHDSQIDVLKSGNNSFSQFQVKMLPASLTMFKNCAEGCLAWASDGAQFYVLKNDKTWEKLALKLSLPESEKIADISLRLQYGAELGISGALVTTESGQLYVKDEDNSGRKMLGWSDVSKLAGRYCVSCHEDDGFDKEATWAALKSTIIIRLKASATTPGAMPPPGTQAGKEMSAGDKALIVTWLEGIKETGQGPVGRPDGGGAVPDPSLITGSLKVLSDQHCLSCHGEAQKVSWWKARKTSASARINAGTMPPSSNLGADVRASFVNAINALP